MAASSPSECKIFYELSVPTRKEPSFEFCITKPTQTNVELAWYAWFESTLVSMGR